MTGVVMAEQGEGETRLRTRRRKFWWMVGAGVALGAVMGFIAGFIDGYGETRAVSPLLIWPVLGAGIALFSWYSAVYLRRVDELDLQDNLWASLIGLYFYAVALPTWYFLHSLEQVPEINHWAIYIATMVAAGLAYGVRKFR